MTTSHLTSTSKEVELLKNLTGNEYKVFRYLFLTSNEEGVIWGKTTKDIQAELQIGYTTAFDCLKKLKETGLIETNGQKKFIKVKNKKDLI